MVHHVTQGTLCIPYTQFFHMVLVANQTHCFSTSIRCQKLRFVVATAIFGARHSRGTYPLGRAPARKNLCVVSEFQSSWIAVCPVHSCRWRFTAILSHFIARRSLRLRSSFCSLVDPAWVSALCPLQLEPILFLQVSRKL